MRKMYNTIYTQLQAFQNQTLTHQNIIQIYWLTNMACKLVYIDNHFKVGYQKALKYFVRHYNSIMTAKMIDLENSMAYVHAKSKGISVPNNFISSSTFDITTINTIRNVFNAFNDISNYQVKIIHIPKIQVGNLTT